MAAGKFCPNCGSPATADGNRITCEKCDAVFKVTQDGTRVQSLGKIADLDKRVSALEGAAGGQADGPQPDEQLPDNEDDSQPDDTEPAEEEDEDILPR